MHINMDINMHIYTDIILHFLLTTKYYCLCLMKNCSVHSLMLSMYECFKSTSELENTDAMSRILLPDEALETPIPTEIVLVLDQLKDTPVTAAEVKRITKKDTLVSRVLQFTRVGRQIAVDDLKLKPFHSRRTELSTEDSCILWGKRIVTPSPARTGHLGFTAHLQSNKTSSQADEYFLFFISQEYEAHFWKNGLYMTGHQYPQHYYRTMLQNEEARLHIHQGLLSNLGYALLSSLLSQLSLGFKLV